MPYAQGASPRTSKLCKKHKTYSLLFVVAIMSTNTLDL